jgi:murein DD-endopeptidase MepM/ murein hydrolase activator NlpD
MARGSGRDRGRRAGDDFEGDDRYDSGYAQAYGREDDGYDDRSPRRDGALVAVGDRGNLPVAYDDDEAGAGLFIIPGSGQTAGVGLLPRRERPLTMRLAVAGLTACVIFAGLFAVAPLNGGGVDAAHGPSPLQSLSGAVVWHAQVDYLLYVAVKGDTLDSIAAKFNVQVGGIYELNAMLSGQEIEIGKAYKIPKDPNYGMYYRPDSFYSASGTTRYGSSPWTSNAGNPPEASLCAPLPQVTGGNLTDNNMGDYNLASYQLKGPNPGSFFVRGFTWYHNGDDIGQPAGAPIKAAQAGEVIFAGWDTGGGGWTVKIDNCNHVSTFYAHMQTYYVKAHQMVPLGFVIGLEGSTGNSTGPHLHFTVEWNNVPVDPLAFYNWSTYNVTH